MYPRAAEIIFTAFEEQGGHRREMEAATVRGNERRANIGQWLAYSLVLVALGAGIAAILVGEAVAGATIITVAFGGGVVLAVAGVGGRRKGPARETGPTQRDQASATRGSVEPPAPPTNGP